jgi:signal transduction histidine kinase
VGQRRREDTAAQSPATTIAVDPIERSGSGRSEQEILQRRQQALLEFIESISSELELRPLLTRIVRYACDLLGADHGTIGLVDSERNVVRMEAIYNMPEDELGAVMEPGVGIAGHVLKTGQPVVLDRYGDVSQPSRLDGLENPVIGMPIAWHGKMIGFFGIGNHASEAETGVGPGRFSEKDLDSLAVFARHAAIAISNARRYEWEQQRTERLRLIARIGQIITANLTLHELLQRAVDAIHELLGYPNVAIPLLEPGDPDVLVLNTVGGHYKRIVKGEHRIPVTQGLMGAAVRAREVVLVNDVASDPRHLPTPGADGITAELAVPIRLGDRVLGVLNVESSDPFTLDDAASLEIVADQLSVAIENARLYERAQRLAVLEERQRLARDLHDAVTQHIFGMNLIAQSLGPAWKRDPSEAERRVARLLDLSRMAMGEMRALLAEMRPAESSGADPDSGLSGLALVRRQGLAEALRRQISNVASDELRVVLDVRTYRLQPPEIEEALFRIAQEALSNVVKHAHAANVMIRLALEDGTVRLSVRDDGVGFRPRDLPARADGDAGGLGLSTMQERAQELGGSLEVRSSRKRGTMVEACLPSRVGGSQ